MPEETTEVVRERVSKAERSEAWSPVMTTSGSRVSDKARRGRLGLDVRSLSDLNFLRGVPLSSLSVNLSDSRAFVWDVEVPAKWFASFSAASSGTLISPARSR